MVCLHDLPQDQCSLCNGSNVRLRPVELRAAQVELWIPALNENPVSKAELAEVSGVPERFIGEAVAFLRDNNPDLPLISDSRGYRWSKDQAEVDAYRASRAKTAHTQLGRTWTGVVRPYLENVGAPKAVIDMTEAQWMGLVNTVKALTS